MTWLPALVYMYLWLASSTRADICQEKICEYTFDVQWKRTMTFYHHASGNEYDVEYKDESFVVVRGGRGVTDRLIGLELDARDVIVGDGHHRNVITINGLFPGPNIEVMEGTEVVVHVYNNLSDDAVTVHWHGMHQKNGNWMDGVANITQCPIAPGETFTYTFSAFPGGLHWYHSHVLNQRNDGLYGALVVHRLQIPSHIVLLSQLFRYEARDIRKMAAETDELQRHQMHSNGPHDQMHGFENHTVIINGRGRHNADDSNIPWIEFPVKPEIGYRFDVIHAGADYALKVSIDEHRLTILSLDGFAVVPTEIDKFFIYPGETIEFGVVTDQNGEAFWIRVEETQLHTHGSQNHGSHAHNGHTHNAGTKKRQVDKPGDPLDTNAMHLHTYAVLRYTGTPSVSMPDTSAVDCLSQACVVFNCPEEVSEPGESCMPLGDIKGFDSTNAAVWEKLDLLGEPDHEFVLNFMLSGKPGATGSSVNGKKFVWPPTPMFNFKATEHDCRTCNDCDKCTHIVTLPANTVVELTLSNLQREQPIYSHHPIHLHGYHFAVMKIGYPSFDNATKTWTPALGITCQDKYCTRVIRVKDERRHSAELHGVEPPLKNTILVPAYGYVVVRIFTDNPGFWFMHCHAAQHLLDGMAVIIEVTPVPAVPKDFPCHNSYDTFTDASTNDAPRRASELICSFLIILQALGFVLSR